MQDFLPRNEIQPYRGGATYGSQGRSDNSLS